jgi:hypothetical protein
MAYLQNAYRNWEVPPEYVMIVGDLDGTFAVNDYPYSAYASDHHYACVDGTDYMADIFVARMSVDNMTEARRALSKIIKYEKYPYMNDPQHWIRGLSAAATYYESARLVTLWVRQLMLQNGFAQVDTAFGWDDYLADYFNNGVSFIQYRGAGSSDGWSSPPWGVSNLLSMQNNQKLGVMASLTCGTGDFEYECFGETWLRMGLSPDSLKGGPAFYGVTDHDTHTRWNNPIMVGYYFGIFNEDVYHFAPAAVRGKLQEWLTFPRYRTPGNYVEQYFNTYNMLGDPELEMRTRIPMRILVAHPDTVPYGPNHMKVTVTDTLGLPIEGAFVTLIKGTSDTTEEFFSVEKTDSGGEVSLSFDALTVGPITLTVSGRDLYPHQSVVEITAVDAAVGLDSIFLNDDAIAPSNGDGDGLPASGETIELSVWLRNYGSGQTVQGIGARLESMDDLTTVLDSSRTYGDLLPGEARPASTPFIVRISPHANDGDVARIKLMAVDQNSDSWISAIEIPIIAPEFVVNRVVIAGSDTILSPGETAQMVLTIGNLGGLGTMDVAGTITSDNDYARIISDSGSFGDIPAGGIGDNTSSPMTIACDAAAFEGHRIKLILHTITRAGARATIPFSISVGRISNNDPVGPDAYGYYMYDTKDSAYACMPTYNWVEISPDSGGGGTRLNFSYEIDDRSALVMLPFDMVYYGEPHRGLIVCINGFAALDTFSMDSGGRYWANFFNWPIPDPGNAQGQISPFWDDLRIDGTHYGVYTWFDAANHLFYIEWLRMSHTNLTAYQTFQMIIYDPLYHTSVTGDSEIRFVYRDVNNIDISENYASVGFESWDERSGLEYTHDNFYAPGATILTDNQVILITTNTGRGGIRGHVELNNGGQNGGVRVSVPSGQYRFTDDSGDFWMRDIPSGFVTLTAETRGFFPAIAESVDVDINKTTGGINLSPILCPIPVGLTASDDLLDRVIVTWNALDHPNLVGYNVYRSRWQAGEYLKLNGQPVANNTYTDTTLPDTMRYWFYVTAVFAGQDWTAESFASDDNPGRRTGPVGVPESGAALPATYFLDQNYPNPFNPTTTISYGLPNNSHVKIEIFDILGRKIATLADKAQEAGYYRTPWTAGGLSSGIYFARMEAGEKAFTIRLVFLK